MFRSSKRTRFFFFVFHSLIVLGSLIWRTNYFTNQLKHKAVPFLAYLWSVIIPRSEISLPFLCVASKQDQDDRSVKPPLTVLDHAQILREVMSVYQSSMLGNEDEDERDTGFRQVLDIMVTPVASMCISNAAHKKTIRPEWDDKVFVLNCLCYLQECFFFPFISFLFK